MLVAGHRGVRVGARENTMEAFHMAARAGVDMIETDLHMTKDGVIILMHDHTIDRTTSGSGLIRNLTYREILQAANDVPTLEEFICGTQCYEGLTYNFEFKDYPADGESWAWESMRKSIDLIEKYNLRNRCVVNSFSGTLLERVDEEYDHAYRLHGFYPWHILGEHRRDPREYLFCACMCGQATYGEPYYRELIEGGVEPWIGAAVTSREQLAACAALGARLVTTDDPADTIAHLKALGLRK